MPAAASVFPTMPMDGRRVAGDERVPPVEVAAFIDQPVAAGGRQPGDIRHILLGQLHAVRHEIPAVLIAGAAAAFAVEKLAADRGEIDIAAIPFLDLVETTEAAAVAEAFPLGDGHFGKRLTLPEGQIVHRSFLATATRKIA